MKKKNLPKQSEQIEDQEETTDMKFPRKKSRKNLSRQDGKKKIETGLKLRKEQQEKLLVLTTSQGSRSFQ